MTAKKTVKKSELEQQIGELTQDLQRTRADFENYRKRIEAEKQQARDMAKFQTICKILPIIDTIDRATAHLPKDLRGNSWAEGVVAMSKNVQKLLAEYDIKKIVIKPNKTEFDPDLHEAISMDDQGGEREIIAEELQTGYMMGESVLRHAMVRVVRTSDK